MGENEGADARSDEDDSHCRIAVAHEKVALRWDGSRSDKAAADPWIRVIDQVRELFLAPYDSDPPIPYSATGDLQPKNISRLGNIIVP